MPIYDKVCRLCLKVGDLYMISLFNPLKDNGLCAQIFHLTGVQISEGDNLPSSICILCNDKIDNFEKFKHQVQKSASILQQQIEASNKGENADENIDTMDTEKDLSNSMIKEEKKASREEIIKNVDEDVYLILQKSINKNSADSNGYTMDDRTPTDSKETPDGKPLQCKICRKVFKTKTTLRRHQVVHTDHEYHKCVECHKIFAHKHNLVKHFRIHSGLTLACTICLKMFSQPEYLKHHMMYTHSGGDPLSCDICGRLYKNSVTLTVHKKTVHSHVNGTNKVVCTVCGKLLGSNALSKHMNTHNTVQRIKCDLCDKSYKNRYIMMEHRKSHLKLHASCCDVCGKTFKTNGILKNHKLTHSLEKQFSCSMCSSKFTQSAALRTHQRVHTGIEPYTCSCGEKFRWKQTYDKHVFKCTQRTLQVY